MEVGSQIVDVVVIFITFSVKTVQSSVSTSSTSREDRLVNILHRFYHISHYWSVNFLDDDVSAQNRPSSDNLLIHTSVLSTHVITKSIRCNKWSKWGEVSITKAHISGLNKWMGSPQMYDGKNLSLESKLEKFKVSRKISTNIFCHFPLHL